MPAQAKNDEVIAALLLLLAEITSLLALRPSQEQQDAGKELVSHVINRRIKVRRALCLWKLIVSTQSVNWQHLLEASCNIFGLMMQQ